MKKLSLILLLTGIASSSLIQGAESFEIRAARAAAQKSLAQKPLTEEEIATLEEQASQRRLAQKKQKITAEFDKDAQQKAIERLQAATERAKKPSERWYQTAAEIGSIKTAVVEPLEETSAETALTPERAAQIRSNLETSSQRIKNAAQRRIDQGTIKDYSIHPANKPLAEGPKFADLPPDIQADILIKNTIADIEEPGDFIKRIAPWLRVSNYFKATIYSPKAADIIAQQLSSKFKISREDAYLAIKTPGATQALSEYLAVQMRNPTKRAAVQTKVETILRKMQTGSPSQLNPNRMYLIAAIDTGLIDPEKIALHSDEKGPLLGAMSGNDLDLIKAILKLKISSQQDLDYALINEFRSSKKKEDLVRLKLLLDAGANSNNPDIEKVIEVYEQQHIPIPFQDQKMQLINEYRKKTSVLAPQTR